MEETAVIIAKIYFIIILAFLIGYIAFQFWCGSRITAYVKELFAIRETLRSDESKYTLDELTAILYRVNRIESRVLEQYIIELCTDIKKEISKRIENENTY